MIVRLQWISRSHLKLEVAGSEEPDGTGPERESDPLVALVASRIPAKCSEESHHSWKKRLSYRRAFALIRVP